MVDFNKLDLKNQIQEKDAEILSLNRKHRHETETAAKAATEAAKLARQIKDADTKSHNDEIKRLNEASRIKLLAERDAVRDAVRVEIRETLKKEIEKELQDKDDEIRLQKENHKNDIEKLNDAAESAKLAQNTKDEAAKLAQKSVVDNLALIIKELNAKIVKINQRQNRNRNTISNKELMDTCCFHIFKCHKDKEDIKQLLTNLRDVFPNCNDADTAVFNTLKLLSQETVVSTGLHIIPFPSLSLLSCRKNISEIFEKPKKDWATSITDITFKLLHIFAARGAIGKHIVASNNKGVMSFGTFLTIGQILKSFKSNALEETSEATDFINEVKRVMKVRNVYGLKAALGKGSGRLTMFLNIMVELTMFALLCKEIFIDVSTDDDEETSHNNIKKIYTSKPKPGVSSSCIALDEYLFEHVMKLYQQNEKKEIALNRMKQIRTFLSVTSKAFYVKPTFLGINASTSKKEKERLLKKESDRMLAARETNNGPPLFEVYLKAASTRNPYDKEQGESKTNETNTGPMTAGIQIIGPPETFTKKQLDNQKKLINSSSTRRKRNVGIFIAMLSTGKEVDGENADWRLLENYANLASIGAELLKVEKTIVDL